MGEDHGRERQEEAERLGIQRQGRLPSRRQGKGEGFSDRLRRTPGQGRRGDALGRGRGRPEPYGLQDSRAFQVLLGGEEALGVQCGFPREDHIREGQLAEGRGRGRRRRHGIRPARPDKKGFQGAGFLGRIGDDRRERQLRGRVPSAGISHRLQDHGGGA